MSDQNITLAPAAAEVINQVSAVYSKKNRRLFSCPYIADCYATGGKIYIHLSAVRCSGTPLPAAPTPPIGCVDSPFAVLVPSSHPSKILSSASSAM